MNGAGRRCGNFADTSPARRDAQSRGEIESPRARGPNTAGCEFSFATVLRTPALQSKRTCSLAAYGAPTLKAEPLEQLQPPEGMGVVR